MYVCMYIYIYVFLYVYKIVRRFGLRVRLDETFKYELLRDACPADFRTAVICVCATVSLV